MTEMTWTTLYIGGKITPKQLEQLTDLINEDFSEQSGDAPEDAIAEGRAACIQGHVNYGEPEAVKEFCRAHKLAYWHHYDAGYEWDAGIKIWRPGYTDEAECSASGQGYEPLLTLQELEKRAANGATLAGVIEGLRLYKSEAVPTLVLKVRPGVAKAQAAPTP